MIKRKVYQPRAEFALRMWFLHDQTAVGSGHHLSRAQILSSKRLGFLHGSLLQPLVQLGIAHKSLADCRASGAILMDLRATIRLSSAWLCHVSSAEGVAQTYPLVNVSTRRKPPGLVGHTEPLL